MTRQNVAVAAVVAAVLTFAVGTAAAQDYFFPLFGSYVDHAVPADSPCGYGGVKTIAPATFDDTIMLWYLCEDGRVVARRFFRAGGGAETPKPVYVVAAPGIGTSPLQQPLTPVPSAPGCPVGFVAGGDGCVPPDHPLAGR